MDPLSFPLLLLSSSIDIKLRALALFAKHSCVSLLLPTHHIWNTTQQVPTRKHKHQAPYQLVLSIIPSSILSITHTKSTFFLSFPFSSSTSNNSNTTSSHNTFLSLISPYDLFASIKRLQAKSIKSSSFLYWNERERISRATGRSLNKSDPQQ